MKISYAIMAHPRRGNWVQGLASALPEAKVVWDQKNILWDTGRRSLLAYAPDADYHVVVQDDAILCHNFPEACYRALCHVPQLPVGLYLGQPKPHGDLVTKAFERALAEKTSWIEMQGPWWGVGIAIPTLDIPALVAWGDLQQMTRYDRRIATWYAQQEKRCWYCLPSLVDHRRETGNPSLVPGHAGDRWARLFVGSDSDAHHIDWSTPPLIVEEKMPHP